jgi:ATP-binding cassette subfamily B protein
MIAKYYGRSVSLEYLRNKSEYGKGGVSLLSLADTAESIGLKTIGVKLTYEDLVNNAPLPAILHWDQSHFVVLTRKIKDKLIIADPAVGVIKLDKEDFCKRWLAANYSSKVGIGLLIEEDPIAIKSMDEEDQQGKNTFKGVNILWGYVWQHRTYFIQIIIGLLLTSILQLIFPYLTQSIVDTGINSRDLNFIAIILFAQLMLLFSQTAVEFIRSRILLHISTIINVSILSGFWSKLLKLPMQFFESKHPGDIIQRVSDHHRIEQFLTGTALSSLFSISNLVIFSFVLLSYSYLIFIVYLSASVLYLLWIRIFLKFRRGLDYKYFALASKENNATMQLIHGIQEIKLNNAENTFRWSWEKVQASLFKVKAKSLSLG